MKLEVYTRRFGRNDSYAVEHTKNGWQISNISIGGVCDKQGKPYLFENLEHDSINYPEALGEYMEYLWEKAKEQSMNDEQIQTELNSIGAWIQATEKASPGGVFSEYK
jgi:hypothetical protein